MVKGQKKKKQLAGQRLSKAHKRFKQKEITANHCKHKVVGPGFTKFNMNSVVFFRDT